MINLQDLLAAGVHFGHRTHRWSPKMRPFIWGAKNKIHLIDISKTAFLLERAVQFVKESTSNGGVILWVGTKKAARQTIESTGQSLDMPYVIHRWIGGTLSNFGQIKKAMTRYLHLRDILSKTSRYTSKKELSQLQKELARLEKNVGGILKLNFPPAALVLVDAKKECAAIREARNLGIPVIAMVDTNTDPTGINFVIPANDDAPRSISCIMSILAQAAQEGVAHYSKTRETAENLEMKKRAKSVPVKEVESVIDEMLETESDEDAESSPLQKSVKVSKPKDSVDIEAEEELSEDKDSDVSKIKKIKTEARSVGIKGGKPSVGVKSKSVGTKK